MTEETFKVTFKGKVTRGYEAEKAVSNFAKLFKLSEQKAAVMFDGKERVLKKALAMEKAAHFRAVLKKAGIRVSLVKNQSELPALGSDDWELSDPGTVILRPITQPEVHIETSHIKISLDESALADVPEVKAEDVSIDHIEIDESEDPIIEEPEVEIPEFNTETMTVDDLGTVIVNAEKVEVPDIPVDALSLDEVGTVMAEKKNVKEPEIDISSISLTEN